MILRLVTAAAVLALVFGGCADSDVTDTTALPLPATTAPTGSDPPSTLPATPPPVTATTGAPTTTAPTTTTVPAGTTTVAPVAVRTGPTIPAALGWNEVPWNDVGPSWQLALYDSTLILESAVTEGPTMLYLVAPAGSLYEIGAWDPPYPKPWLINDWRPDGTVALLTFDLGPPGTEVRLFDLTTGTGDTVFTRSLNDPFDGAGFTAPRAPTSCSIAATAPPSAWSVTTPAGRSSPLYEQPDPLGPERLTWLYGTDGTTVLVGHAAGIALVENTGDPIRELWVPMAHNCEPVRWWDADQFLAACRGIGPAFPHDYYNQLWLLRTDGTAGAPLNTIPTGPIIEVDFGYTDARQTTSGLRLQWNGDCGAAGVFALAPDGIPTAIPSSVIGEGHEMVDVLDGRLAILSWASCGREGGELLTTNNDLGDPQVIIPRIEGVQGVMSVAGLTN